MKYIFDKNNKLIKTVFDTVSSNDIYDIYGRNISIHSSDIEYIRPYINEDGYIDESLNKKMTVVYDGSVITEILNGIHYVENSKVFDYDAEIIDNIRYCYINETLEIKVNDELRNKELEISKVANLELQREQLITLSKEFENKEKEKPFKFKGYWQPNRELQDQTSLLKIISFLQLNKQKTFSNWKMFDDNLNEVYVTLTVQEMVMLGTLMEQQTTQVMKKYSEIRNKLKTMDIKDLERFVTEFNKHTEDPFSIIENTVIIEE